VERRTNGRFDDLFRFVVVEYSVQIDVVAIVTGFHLVTASACAVPVVDNSVALALSHDHDGTAVDEFDRRKVKQISWVVSAHSKRYESIVAGDENIGVARRTCY
jgi:hypothetical protein